MSAIAGYAAKLVCLIDQAETDRYDALRNLHAQEGVLIDIRIWRDIVGLCKYWPKEDNPATCWLPSGWDPSEAAELGEWTSPEAAAEGWIAAEGALPTLKDPIRVGVSEYRETWRPLTSDEYFDGYEPGQRYWTQTGRTLVILLTLSATTCPIAAQLGADAHREPGR